MKYFIIILAGAIVSCACHRKMPTASETSAIGSEGKNIPTCLQLKIDSIKKLPVWNPPASIEQYDYNGKTVYLVSADCCDFFMAKDTGGLALFPYSNRHEVDGIFEHLIRTLGNQYTVTVQVPQAVAGRKWHPLKVEIKLPPDAPRELKSSVVRHRAGYFDRAGEP